MVALTGVYFIKWALPFSAFVRTSLFLRDERKENMLWIPFRMPFFCRLDRSSAVNKNKYKPLSSEFSGVPVTPWYHSIIQYDLHTSRTICDGVLTKGLVHYVGKKSLIASFETTMTSFISSSFPHPQRVSSLFFILVLAHPSSGSLVSRLPANHAIPSTQAPRFQHCLAVHLCTEEYKHKKGIQT